MAELLIHAGADVNARGVGGNTALMNAARHDNVKLTRLMLSLGVKVNFKVNTHSGYFNALNLQHILPRAFHGDRHDAPGRRRRCEYRCPKDNRQR